MAVYTTTSLCCPEEDLQAADHGQPTPDVHYDGCYYNHIGVDWDGVDWDQHNSKNTARIDDHCGYVRLTWVQDAGYR